MTRPTGRGGDLHIAYCGALVQAVPASRVGKQVLAGRAVQAGGGIRPLAGIALETASVAGVVPPVAVEPGVAAGPAGVVGLHEVAVLAGGASNRAGGVGAGGAVEGDVADLTAIQDAIAVEAIGAGG